MLYSIQIDKINEINFIEFVRIFYKDYPDIVDLYDIIWQNRSELKEEIVEYMKKMTKLNEIIIKIPMSKEEEYRFIETIRNDFKRSIFKGSNEIKETKESDEAKKDLENLFLEL